MSEVVIGFYVRLRVRARYTEWSTVEGIWLVQDVDSGAIVEGACVIEP